MKYIIYFALILMISAPIEKETNMITEDRSSSRTAATTTRKPPAFSGVSGSAKAGNKSPWDKLNSPALAPSGLGGGNGITPNFNTPSSVADGQESYRNRQTPAWVKTIQNAQPEHGGVQRPTGSFFSGGGVARGTPPAQPPAWLGGGGGGRFKPPRGPRGDNVPDAPTTPDLPIINPNEPEIPTGSFIGADGQAILNAGNAAYWMPQGLPTHPTGTFFAGGGSQVAGPLTNTQNGFGTNYGWGGGGGYGGGYGGGRGGGYTSSGYQQWPSDMGLFQWNYKG